MKTSDNMIVKILLGTGTMFLTAMALVALCAVCILNGWVAMEQAWLISCAIHLAAVYLGCLVCCSMTKEKKGIAALFSTALWYVLLLFVSIVILNSNSGSILPSVAAGLFGYGAALLTCVVPKNKAKRHRVKFPSR